MRPTTRSNLPARAGPGNVARARRDIKHLPQDDTAAWAATPQIPVATPVAKAAPTLTQYPARAAYRAKLDEADAALALTGADLVLAGQERDRAAPRSSCR